MRQAAAVLAAVLAAAAVWVVGGAAPAAASPTCPWHAQYRIVTPHDNDLLPNDVSVTARVEVHNRTAIRAAMASSRCEDELHFSRGVAMEPIGFSRQNPNEVVVRVPVGVLNRCKARRMTLRIQSVFDGSDTSEECSVEDTVSVIVQSDHLAATYIVAALMSVIGCVVMMYLYLRYPLLRAWPSTMVFWRTFCHFMLACCFVYINAWEVADHHTEATCNFLIAALTQLALLGSLGWYFCLALNFFFSISNPFRRPQSLLGRYHALVWGSSISTAAYTMLNWGYRVDFQLCWISKQSGFNVSNWVVYGIWLVLVGVISIAIMGVGWVRLSSSRRKRTFETRMTSLRQTRIYVVVFSIYWVILSTLWGIVAIESKDSDVLVQNTAVSALFAVVIGGIGVVDVGSWVYIQWEPLQESRRREEEEAELSESAFRDKEQRNFDDISDALRHEFIAAISQGLENATDPGQRGVAASGGGRRYRPSASSRASRRTSPSTSVSELASLPSSRRGGGGGGGGGGAGMRDSLLGFEADSAAREDPARMASATWTDMSDDTYRFTSYGEDLFREMRERVFGVSQRDYRRSVALVDDDEDEAEEDGGNSDAGRGRFGGGLGDPELGATDRDFASRPTDTGAGYYAASDSAPRKRSLVQDRRDAKIDSMVQHFSEGASGSFFYFTLDKRYMIKTLPAVEAELLLRILPSYRDFMQRNPDSLISRFFGLYSVRMYGHTQFVVVMNNALRVPSGYKILEKYDLKGSTVKRHGKLRNGKGTRKDNDLNQPVQIGRALGEHIKAQAKADTAFLQSHNIMDYSLLMGVHVCSEPRTGHTHCGGLPLPVVRRSADSVVSSAAPSPSLDMLASGAPARPGGAGADLDGPDDLGEPVALQFPGGAPADGSGTGSSGDPSPRRQAAATVAEDVDEQPGDSRASRFAVIKSTRLCGPGVYHFAIIDLLQEWTWEKKLERWFKIIFRLHCHDALWISAVEPETYHRRFTHMLERVFEYNEDATVRIRPVTGSGLDTSPQPSQKRHRKGPSSWFSLPTRILGNNTRRSGGGSGGGSGDNSGSSGDHAGGDARPYTTNDRDELRSNASSLPWQNESRVAAGSGSESRNTAMLSADEEVQHEPEPVSESRAEAEAADPHLDGHATL